MNNKIDRAIKIITDENPMYFWGYNTWEEKKELIENTFFGRKVLFDIAVSDFVDACCIVLYKCRCGGKLMQWSSVRFDCEKCERKYYRRGVRK